MSLRGRQTSTLGKATLVPIPHGWTGFQKLKQGLAGALPGKMSPQGHGDLSRGFVPGWNREPCPYGVKAVTGAEIRGMAPVPTRALAGNPQG